MPIYRVLNRITTLSRLVEADNPAQAIRHVAREHFVAVIPSTAEALALSEDGVKLEHADLKGQVSDLVEQAEQAGVRG